MNLQQMQEIAGVGFPDQVKLALDFSDLEIFNMNTVYRLYKVSDGFGHGTLPKTTILSIDIQSRDFVQINPGIYWFNHYAAIKKMEELNLIYTK